MSDAAESQPRAVCQLQAAAGRIESCPELECPFWEDDECVIAGLRSDYEHDPELVQLLLSLRARLASAPRQGWSPLYLLPAKRDR
jgi:hypothetical protein